MAKENQIESGLIRQLEGLKYVYRQDIIDRKPLEQNFRAKFEALNRVRLSDNEFLRLRKSVIFPESATKVAKNKEQLRFVLYGEYDGKRMFVLGARPSLHSGRKVFLQGTTYY